MFLRGCVEDDIVCTVVDEKVMPLGAGYHGHTQFLRKLQTHVCDTGA